MKTCSHYPYPVLSKQHISDLLELSSRPNLFKECLPFSAYTFSDGPWAHLWCRYSYSPQCDPNNWIFQSIRVKLTHDFMQGISDKLEGYLGRDKLSRRLVDLDDFTLTDSPTEFSKAFIDKGANARVPIFFYQQILKFQVSFQVVNIQDEIGLNYIFHDMKRLSIFQDDLKSGFFSVDSCERFRQFIIQCIEKRTEDMLKIRDMHNNRMQPNHV
ncbi:hypothetical protein EON65_56855 [archaeon]|nr:MAG: hypothetical protein EON65_56855 [archaeon]